VTESSPVDWNITPNEVSGSSRLQKAEDAFAGLEIINELLFAKECFDNQIRSSGTGRCGGCIGLIDQEKFPYPASRFYLLNFTLICHADMPIAMQYYDYQRKKEMYYEQDYRSIISSNCSCFIRMYKSNSGFIEINDSTCSKHSAV
jgi:hypothetical protein